MPGSRNAIHAGNVSEFHPSTDRHADAAPCSGEIAQAFGRLSVARIECGKCLELEIISDIVFNPNQFTQGVPLLADVDPQLLQGAYRQAASLMLPELISAFPGIVGELRILETALAQTPETADTLLNMLVNKNMESLAQFSASLGISERTLGFVGMEILKPCIQRAAELLGPLIADMPWSKGNCPICGSQPDMALLRPKDPEPSEYLVSKSGQLWLHCSLCAHQWRFLRSKCPYCGDTEPGNLMYFDVCDRKDERVYACNKCKHYYPCLDTTNRPLAAGMHLGSLALIHLDVVAQERGFKPLACLPWNQFA